MDNHDLVAMKKDAHTAIAALEQAWKTRVAAEHELVAAKLSLAKLRVASAASATDLHNALAGDFVPCW